ncbi:MAG TPA: hypothetical protein VIU62_03770, partial [Chloroflexota bacterium]
TLAGGGRNHAMIHFTDWLPTLLKAAGQSPAAGLPLDGGNVMSVLQGDSGDTITQRFWQWNRYTPVVISNAAARDGDWKLVRPALREAMRVAPEDGVMDRRLKYEPEGITDIDRTPEPARTLPEPPAPLLFNVAEDPFEQHDLASAQPERAAILLRSLETWFAAVEAERATIHDD